MLLIHRLDVTDAPHEGTPDNDVRGSFELDFFCATQMLRAVLPGFGCYSAAEYAVERLTDALRHEVTPFGGLCGGMLPLSSLCAWAHSNPPERHTLSDLSVGAPFVDATPPRAAVWAPGGIQPAARAAPSGVCS
ncbi:hypothetical protein SSTG_05704 [Streptomyces sp. e14]|uniref:hypothetical protein n=1 Tax=Streptomyces sp. e14 TaxID=645465 RepID=UPI0001D05B80|nr:hypothetical protein [Streptomyces sp. e14]EFF88697.1 hypothetical protein SSTG_05704 [Streptomyces sp. e14]